MKNTGNRGSRNTALTATVSAADLSARPSASTLAPISRCSRPGCGSAVVVIAVLKWGTTSRRNTSHCGELCSNFTIASTFVGRLNARPSARASGLENVTSVIASDAGTLAVDARHRDVLLLPRLRPRRPRQRDRLTKPGLWYLAHRTHRKRSIIFNRLRPGIPPTRAVVSSDRHQFTV